MYMYTKITRDDAPKFEQLGFACTSIKVHGQHRHSVPEAEVIETRVPTVSDFGGGF